MAVVRTINIEDKTDKRRVQGPFIRAILNAKGCIRDDCTCSEGHHILISNGDVLLTVKLTAEEAEELFRERYLFAEGKEAN